MEYTGFFEVQANPDKKRAADIMKISRRVCSFFWDASPKRPHFEEREGQADMAFEILDAIKNDQHILVEAGVGIGKSFAYLVPLLLRTNQGGGTIVIATSTIALQEQLMRDIRFLHEQLGTRLRLVLAKGQTNYICMKRVEEYQARPDAEMPEELAASIAAGHQDRAEYPGDLPQGLWEQICVKQFGYRCRKCHRRCLYRDMRSELRFSGGLVVCNQDFLTAHLLRQSRGLGGLINESVKIVVIDEAHNLESKVRSATTRSLEQARLLTLIKQVQHEVPAEMTAHIQGEVNSAKSAVRAFFKRLQEQVRRQIAESEQDMKYADRFFFRQDENSLALLRDMASTLKRLSESAQILSTLDLRRGDSGDAADDFYETADALSTLTNELHTNLLWIERKGRALELVFCPRNMRNIIRELYFEGNIRTVLTSATLTNTTQGSLQDMYSYFISNTGFPLDERGFLSEPKPSPFPYDEHSMLYYCDDLPHPTQERGTFIQAGVERLVEILDISHGKALVLFTAKTDLEEVYQALQSRDLPYQVLKQQPGPSQDQVLKEFRDNVDSVLLGTGAYWEGIDIKGKSLSNLVIFRLPFPVPDPIIEDKVSMVKDGLMEVRVPEMIIKLKQGIGRLIRSASDTGIVSIIDPRLRDHPPARYRDIVWSSLPIQNRTTSLEVLSAFYASLRLDGAETRSS